MPHTFGRSLQSFAVLLSTLYTFCVYAGPPVVEGPNPFKKYQRVAQEIYVADRSLFTRTSSSPRQLRPEDANHADVERKRLGAVTVAPGIRLNLESLAHPTGSEYELRDPKTDSLIHKFYYDHSPVAPLLFTGQGVIYEHAALGPLCWGAVTRKYVLADGAIQEIRQPMVFLNADTPVLRTIKLYSSPDGSGNLIATLTEGMTATVLTVQNEHQFLLRTPLGLTGWHIDDPQHSGLEITQCN
jgi:hypothetical protein